MNHRFLSFVFLVLLISSLAACSDAPKPTEGGTLPDQEGRYGVMISLPGLNHDDILKATALTNELGTKIARLDFPVYWDDIASVGFNETTFDELYKRAQFKILFTLYEGRPSQLPNDIDDYKQRVKQIVSKYKEKAPYFQIENEVYGKSGFFWQGSKEDYVKTLNAGYEAVKEACPDCGVLLAGIALGEAETLPDLPLSEEEASSPEAHFLAYVLRNGQYDIVDLHLYYKAELIQYRLDWLKRQMTRLLERQKPIWVTENGAPDFRNSAHASRLEDESFQAEELKERFRIIFSNGVEKAFWHKVYMPRFNNEWDYMSLVIGDHKKEAFYTFQHLIKSSD
jgi:hypothetical protein